MAKAKDTFSQREIALNLNNAVVRALKPTRISEIDDTRLRDLRAYAQALIEPAMQHVLANLLQPEELVAVLASSALYVHLTSVMGTNKVPMAHKAQELLEEDE